MLALRKLSNHPILNDYSTANLIMREEKTALIIINYQFQFKLMSMHSFIHSGDQGNLVGWGGGRSAGTRG